LIFLELLQLDEFCYDFPMGKRVFTLTSLFCLSAWMALGQGTTSRLVGVVLDTSGAAVPNANVRLTNEGTSTSFTTVTGSAGAYTFEAIQPGKYRVSVEAAGFRKFESRGNPVSIG